jgi:hypothetical protein
MIEYIKFYDHTKSVCGQVSPEQALDLDIHVGEFCAEVIKEDDKCVTISLIRWESNKDVSHEFVFVILKANIIDRHEVVKA